ncbi:hypothetical protein FVE85_7920 [Porphyridium purpureum]|uniref:ParB/Sulfiredoxin domain-containing protein n=1 Tax=Porphyridium purpureum TaxID=35688 RepID=A0A5J4YNY4_PORPP|nr:hypothetical protein FVE85_7920 [Porphyridium purpureum]|eukprot:POR5702..scf295_9
MPLRETLRSPVKHSRVGGDWDVVSPRQKVRLVVAAHCAQCASRSLPSPRHGPEAEQHVVDSEGWCVRPCDCEHEKQLQAAAQTCKRGQHTDNACELERLRQENAQLAREAAIHKAQAGQFRDQLRMRDLELSEAHRDLHSMSRKLQNALYETAQVQNLLDRTRRATRIHRKRLEAHHEERHKALALRCATETARALKLLSRRLHAELGIMDLGEDGIDNENHAKLFESQSTTSTSSTPQTSRPCSSMSVQNWLRTAQKSLAARALRAAGLSPEELAALSDRDKWTQAGSPGTAARQQQATPSTGFPDTQSAASGSGHVADSSAAAAAASATATAAAAAAETAAASHAGQVGQVVHKVFGRALHDVGYKQIYMTSVEKLVQVPSWNKNRAYKPNRALAMAKEKIASKSTSLPGIITCCQLEGGDTFILDGQHRRGALEIMLRKGAWPAGLESLLVEVFPIRSESDAKALFVEINKAEPVKTIDLPDVASEAVANALLYAAGELSSTYPTMFSDSERCRIPQVNADVLRNELFESGILERYHIYNGEDCLQFLLNMNKKMSKYTDQEWETLVKSKALPKALEKARKHDFYLGIDKSWMNRE